MRLNRTLLIALTLTALVLPLASPPEAAAGSIGCQKTYATLYTVSVDQFVEIGELDGTIDGAVYLRYDDTAPPVDPELDSANFVITSKAGDINLWVYNDPDFHSSESVWRDFTIIRAEGTGIYAKRAIDLKIYGKFMGKMGRYEIEGLICPSKSPKTPKR